jgi:lipopolysaccharide heptosyltransferase I
MRKKLNKPKKILIIKPSSLGDVIHALPFLNAVKKTFPDSQVDWVISNNLKAILEDNPFINELISLDKDSWKSVKKLPKTLNELSALRKTLKSKHYDMVVDLQGLLRSGLIAFSTPTTLKIGFDDAREGSRFFYDRKVPVIESAHAVDKCLEVARAIKADTKRVKFPLYADDASKNKIRKLIGNIKEYAVIVPSARWASKRWPAENFAALIKKLSIPCIITGSKGDKKAVQNIMNLLTENTAAISGTSREKRPARKGASSKTINLCGKTGLKELTALLAGAKAVVTNDTGPMHIAAALNVPVIAIFGPTDPAKTGPYGWQTSRKLKVVKTRVPCSPCRKKRCRELICMTNVSVNAVFKELKEYL